MNSDLSTMRKNLVWDILFNIAKIGRKSGSEKQILDFVKSWASKNKFATETDKV